MTMKTKRSDKQKLTIYFGREDAIERFEEAYKAYEGAYKGLAVSRNRFYGALIVEGIEAYMKDHSIGWAYV